MDQDELMTREQYDRATGKEELYLRDQFACAALTGLLAAEYTDNAEEVVAASYDIADLMLTARTQKKETP